MKTFQQFFETYSDLTKLSTSDYSKKSNSDLKKLFKYYDRAGLSDKEEAIKNSVKRELEKRKIKI